MSQPQQPHGVYGTEDAPVAEDAPVTDEAPTHSSPYLSSDRAPSYGSPDGLYAGLNPTASYNPWAIAALVLGLSATAIIAVIAGHVALSQIKRSGERGFGLAVAGLVLGYLEIVFYIGLFLAAFGFLAALRSTF